MIQRIWTLSSYLLFRLITSISGLWFFVGTAVFYWLAFRVRTPEAAYFALVIGLFGAGATFLAVMTMAGRANEAQSLPFFVRLESRIEYLAAVFGAGFLLALLLQIAVAGVVLIRNSPQLTIGQALDLPPIWLSVNIVLAVLALHASDFVADGWSRVRLFGLLAVLILIGENFKALLGWGIEQMRVLSYQPAGNATVQAFANNLRRWADGLANFQGESLQETASLVFWPFRAIIDAALQGFFSRTQALAPAVLVLAATLLFLLAADVFAHKDLILVED